MWRLDVYCSALVCRWSHQYLQLVRLYADGGGGSGVSGSAIKPAPGKRLASCARVIAGVKYSSNGLPDGRSTNQWPLVSAVDGQTTCTVKATINSCLCALSSGTNLCTALAGPRKRSCSPCADSTMPAGLAR